MAAGPYGALLEAVRGVRWPAQRAVSAGATGAHPSHTRGSAAELVEYRPYRQGDDPRRLDWKLLARSDRAFTRLAPHQAVLGTLVAVDASASMAFPPVAAGTTHDKWSSARHIAVACAAIAHAAGDPVGLCAVNGDGARRVAPRTRRGIVAEIARALDDTPARGSAALERAFETASARVLLITDCLGDLDALTRAARAHVASGGEVRVAHVVSRAELEVSRGAVLAVDPEQEHIARSLDATSRVQYRAAFDVWRERVAREWRDAGVVYREIVDDEPADVAVRRIVAPPATRGSRP